MSLPLLERLSPEAQLLFHAVRKTPDEGAIQRLLAGPVEWSRLLELANREQALTILPRMLRVAGRDAVPAEHRARLDQLAWVGEFHLAHLQQRFEESLGALAANGMDVVLLKGVGLVYTAYRSFSDRPMSDVDLLVRPADGTHAQALLGTMGWQWSHDAESDAYYADHHHLPPMYDTGGVGASMELHTGLFPAGNPLGLTASAIWERARPLIVAGTTTYVPDPHHQLLHACLHFAWGHTLQSGAWRTFRDVDAIIGTGEIDWAEFVALAEASRGASCCYWTFDLAKTLGGVVSVPEWVLLRLRPPHPRMLRERLRRHLALMVFPSESASPSVGLDHLVWEAAIMPDHHRHGRARPWARDDLPHTAAHAVIRQRRPGRLRAQLLKAGVYTRYLRLMLTR